MDRGTQGTRGNNLTLQLLYENNSLICIKLRRWEFEPPFCHELLRLIILSELKISANCPMFIIDDTEIVVSVSNSPPKF